MSHSPLSRLAGPTALVAGALIVVAELVMWPFDPKDHVATSTDPVFQAGGIAYLVGFILLVFTLITSYAWQADKVGRFGLVATGTAIVGTMLLGGDLWFETFAVPWLADQSPGALDTDPTLLLALGAISSYLLFAVGWVLFGVASLRARVFPPAISAAIVAGGVVGFNALLAPFGIPLGLAVASLGGWMIRTTSSTREISAQPAVVADGSRLG